LNPVGDSTQNEGGDVPATNEKDNVCRTFRAKGSCRFGDECRYSHVVDPQAPPRVMGDGICHTFRDQGECKFGDECRFKHGADDPRFTDGSRAPRRRVRQPTSRDAQGNEACRAFAKDGSCRYGDQCRYSHSEIASVDPLPTEDGDQQRGNRRTSRRNVEEKGNVPATDNKEVKEVKAPPAKTETKQVVIRTVRRRIIRPTKGDEDLKKKKY